MIKSPSGSTFPYYYKGGEIHALKYGGLHGDETRLYELMDAEEAFIHARPAQRLRVWVDFYDTDVTGSTAKRFAEHIQRLQGQLVRLAVVGCHRGARRRIGRAISEIKGSFAVSLAFYEEPEDAKTWLVDWQ